MKNLKLSKIKRGFTLIEILLVVAILAILLVVVFAALNPATRLQDTRNARRWNDVNNILTAIHTCVVDDGTSGALANCGVTDGSPGTLREIVNGASSGCGVVCGVADGECEDMAALVSGGYLASLPVDPTAPATDHTSYSVISNDGVVTVAACGAEGAGVVIQVSR